jgi:polyisoprenoid-binding protein YceI
LTKRKCISTKSIFGIVLIFIASKNEKKMATTKWTLDPAHSEVQFKIKHLMISTVTGALKKIDVKVETNDTDFTNANINLVADVNYIDTNNEQRDEHLKTSEFFDTTKYSEIIFESSKMEKIDNANYKLYGNFIIKGISKPVVLDVEFGGIAEDRFGNTKAGFSINGKINRQDFSVGPKNNPGLGDEIKLQSNLQVVKQP